MSMGGGGGGGAPTQSTSYSTNIPEYAKPYVTNMLGATQAQIFNTEKVQTGTTESGQPIYENQITGFKPYQPYSKNVNDYFAGPSPMQQQAYQGMANMQVAPQLGQATGMAGQAAQGAMGTAGTALGYGQQGVEAGQAGMGYGQQGAGLGVSGGAQYGSMGAGLGAYAAGAGQRYQQMATSPESVAAYMNPYIQQSLAPQLALLSQQQALAGQDIAAKATGAGAFGGNRATLAQGLNAQNFDLARQQAIGQGYNQAFQQAQQAQQYGAGLGLQGLQTGIQGAGLGLQGVGTQLAGTAQGMQGAGLGIQGAQAGLQGVQGAQNAYNLGLQGASTLGQLGQAQYGQQMGILEGQNRFGAQQQQMEQAKINQAISDYATAQQYPMMQLGLMSNMLRGLPMQATTTQSYQATPGIYQQGIGAIGTLAGAKQAGLFNEGGPVKGLAAGGAIRYADTGAVEANPQSSVTRGIQAKLASMTEEQLKQVAATSPSEEIRAMANEMIAQKEIEKQAEQRAQQSMPQQPAQPQGIAAAPAGSMDTLGAAGGGIIAFANKGAVPDVYDLESDEDRLARIQKQQELVGITGKPMENYGKYIADQIAAQGDAESKMKGLNLMGISSRFGTITGGPLYAAQQAVQGEMPEIIKRGEALKSREGQLMKGQAEIENADRLEKAGFIKEANAEREKGLNRIKDLEVANIHARATASRPTDLTNTYNIELAALGKEGKDITDPVVQREARDRAIAKSGMAGAKFGINLESKVDAAHKQIDAAFKDRLNMAEALGDEKKIAELKTEIKTAKDAVTKRYQEASTLLSDSSAPTAAPAPTSGLPATATGPNGETLYLQPNGKYSTVKPKG